MESIPVLIINLARRPDRLSTTRSRLAAAGFTNIHVMEAIDGHSLSMTPWLDKMFVDNDFISRRGIIGCACSHYFVWKHLCESTFDMNGFDHALIVEDDIILSDTAMVTLNEMQESITKESFCLLGQFYSSSEVEM